MSTETTSPDDLQGTTPPAPGEVNLPDLMRRTNQSLVSESDRRLPCYA